MVEPVTPGEGLGILHLFLRLRPGAIVDHPEAGRDIAQVLAKLGAELQLHVFTGLGHKADLVVMLVDADLVRLRQAQSHLMAVADLVLDLSWSYLSLTETSEYTTTAEQYHDELVSKGVEGEDLERRVQQFSERMATYDSNKLNPDMPRWETMCFYPMSHRREGDDNWYGLAFEERRRLMHEHGRSGRAYTGRVVQLVSGSTGIDDWEWGVTLFAHDIGDLKEIVYQLRYDEASARFAEFGPFVVGLRADPSDAVTLLGWEA